jgi:uncharacterized protein (TIGR02271 family)
LEPSSRACGGQGNVLFVEVTGTTNAHRNKSLNNYAAMQKGMRMEYQQATVVVDRSGRQGTIGEKISASTLGAENNVMVRLGSGREIIVPQDLLIAQDNGTYYLPMDFDELERQHQHRTTSTLSQDDGRIVLPVVEETIAISKRQVETGKVRVRKLVKEHEEQVEETLLREEVEVERIPMNQLVNGSVGVRREGNTTIIPVVEEVLVVEKRLMLKEEIRLTVRQTETPYSERVTLRSEEIQVEREDRTGAA